MSELAWERAFREWVLARGMGWERLRYPRPAAGGETTAYRLSPPGAPRGVVLTVHGAGNDALFGFAGLFKALLGRGYELFSFELDGHGRGGATRFAAETVGDAVQAALHRSGAGARGVPVHALGVSLGGAVLLHSLPRLSPMPDSAVLVCAPLHVHLSRRALLAELGPGLLAALWRGREHYGWLGLIPSFGPYKRDVYPLRLARPRAGAFGYVEALNEALDELRLEAAARATRTPTLLVYGTRDRLVPPEQGERLRGWLPCAELLRVPGATHLTLPLLPSVQARMVEWMDVRRTGAPPYVARSTSHGGEEG